MNRGGRRGHGEKRCQPSYPSAGAVLRLDRGINAGPDSDRGSAQMLQIGSESPASSLRLRKMRTGDP